MRTHENRLRKALIAAHKDKIQSLRELATDSALTHERYLAIVGEIRAHKQMLSDLPEICSKIIDEEEDDD